MNRPKTKITVKQVNTLEQKKRLHTSRKTLTLLLSTIWGSKNLRKRSFIFCFFLECFLKLYLKKLNCSFIKQ